MVALAAAVASVEDLLPALGRADVCPGSGEDCWPSLTSARLHGDGASPGTVLLPPRAHTQLYARLPAGAVLELEHADAGTALVVNVRTDSGAPREVYRAAGGGVGGWQTARVDLAAFAGKVVRLDLQPRPLGTPGPEPGPTVVRRAALLGTGDVPPPAEPPARRPNVVVYLVDTLRADHLGCYGYPRPTTPHIDAFASSALLFRRAVAQSSWTLPSTATVLTGLTPNHHGALELGHAIRPGVPTLAETLGGAGWTTVAFVVNYLGSPAFGHGRGFARFHFYPEDPGRRPGLYLPADALHRRLVRWLDHAPRDRPFFLYVHAADPHWPYLPPPRHARPFVPRGTRPPAWRAVVHEEQRFFMGHEDWGARPAEVSPDRLALLTDLYDGEVHRADEAFGRLVDELGRRGLLDTTVVVLTADHGEELLDHDGLAHGQTLYEEVLHVPLLLRLPGGARGGTRVDELARLVDVMPTVLAAAGVPAPAELDGRSLLVPARRPEAFAALAHMGTELECVTDRDWKVIRDPRSLDPTALEVYDLGHDPRERQNLVDTAPVLAGYGRRRLEELGAARPGPPVAPGLLERLRALGYTR